MHRLVIVALAVTAATGCSDGRAATVTSASVTTVTTAMVQSATVTSTTATSATVSTTTVATATAPSVAPTEPPEPPTVVVSPAVEPTGTTSNESLRTADGRQRTYHVYVPAGLPAGASVPLLVALHGGTGWGTQFERNAGFDGLAQSNAFIVVYPDGIGSGADGTALRTWNAGGCCGPAVREQVDDVAFVRALIEVVEQTYPVDPTRVVVAGHSNGGMMAYRLACELSDQISAIGVQSSALEVPTCTPDKPVSVLHIHGSADQNVPIDGGVGAQAISGVSFNRPIDAASTLAVADGCPPTPTVNTDVANADLTVTTWSPCADHAEVVFVEVAGASHAWMGHATGGSGLVGEPYQRLDSSMVIWNFLAQHMRG